MILSDGTQLDLQGEVKAFEQDFVPHDDPDPKITVLVEDLDTGDTLGYVSGLGGSWSMLYSLYQKDPVWVCGFQTAQGALEALLDEWEELGPE